MDQFSGSRSRDDREFISPAPENSAQREFVSDWSRHDATLGVRAEAPACDSEPVPSGQESQVKQPKDWFEKLTGVTESSPDAVRSNISVDGEWMTSTANGKVMSCGTLETPSLAELRDRVHHIGTEQSSMRLHQQVADVRDLHADRGNTGSLFQVASQFNLLEMVSQSVTPEQGVGGYENDRTQGPACAVAAGAGTIYRNYFASVNGATGQTCDNQIDCLADIGKALGKDGDQLWKMQNGYALPTAHSLEQIGIMLNSMDEGAIDALRGRLRIGIQWNTQVTLDGCSHCVAQAYCSAVPVSYSRLSADNWEGFARLILEAAYEATICTGILNAQRTGNKTVFLTLLGGGAFGNKSTWIMDGIGRGLNLYSGHDLDVVVVSYGRSNPDVDQLMKHIKT
jgi:hypothetical protein